MLNVTQYRWMAAEPLVSMEFSVHMKLYRLIWLNNLVPRIRSFGAIQLQYYDGLTRDGHVASIAI